MLSIFILLVSLFVTFLNGQSDEESQIWPWPWWGGEEYAYNFLPLGGWNTLGSLFSKSTARGETLFAADDSSSGYLNPAFLTSVLTPKLSLSYRYTENTYRSAFSPQIIPLEFESGGWRNLETHSFKRKTDYLDSFGLLLPFKNWVLAANYFLFQEYNFPEIKAPAWFSPEKVAQDGKVKGINFALAYRLTSKFSLGFGATYLLGEISRTEKYQPYFWILDEGGVSSLPFRGKNHIIPPWPWPSWWLVEKHTLNLKGYFFNLGCMIQPSEELAIGFMLRPPFSLNIEAEIEYLYAELPERNEIYSGKYYFKHPLCAGASLLYKPVEAFALTADIFYWGWSQSSTDFYPDWVTTNTSLYFKSVARLNLGAEYRFTLPFEKIDNLSLRAGYIYDPQPYQSQEAFSRNYFTAGFGIEICHFAFDAGAKISLSPKELRRFHQNVFQIGLSYRF